MGIALKLRYPSGAQTTQTGPVRTAPVRKAIEERVRTGIPEMNACPLFFDTDLRGTHPKGGADISPQQVKQNDRRDDQSQAAAHQGK